MERELSRPTLEFYMSAQKQPKHGAECICYTIDGMFAVLRYDADDTEFYEEESGRTVGVIAWAETPRIDIEELVERWRKKHGHTEFSYIKTFKDEESYK